MYLEVLPLPKHGSWRCNSRRFECMAIHRESSEMCKISLRYFYSWVRSTYCCTALSPPDEQLYLRERWTKHRPRGMFLNWSDGYYNQQWWFLVMLGKPDEGRKTEEKKKPRERLPRKVPTTCTLRAILGNCSGMTRNPEPILWLSFVILYVTWWQ